MRPRVITGVPRHPTKDSPGERFQKFVRMIVSVPKAEADKRMRKTGERGSRLSPKPEGMDMETKLKANAGKTGALHVADEDSEAIAIWNLSVLIVPDGNFWFAQGLEIDYAAQGDSVEDAKHNFEGGLSATVHQHLTVHGDISRLLKFAPSEILQEAASRKSLIRRYTQVSLYEVVSPEVEQALPFSGIDYRVLQNAAHT